MCSQTVQLSIYHFISLSLSPPLSCFPSISGILTIYLYIYYFFFPSLPVSDFRQHVPRSSNNYLPLFSTYPFQHFPKQTCFLPFYHIPIFFWHHGPLLPHPRGPRHPRRDARKRHLQRGFDPCVAGPQWTRHDERRPNKRRSGPLPGQCGEWLLMLL